MSSLFAYEPPQLQGLSDEALTCWVAACVAGRKNGATPGEVAALCKLLKRLAPAVGAAMAEPSPDADFEKALETLTLG